MSLSDKARKALAKVGLTASEIRVYSALLKSVEPTAAELSQKAGVPYSKIYEVLGALEEKGWVGSNDSRPTKYFAKSPGTGLDTMKRQSEADFIRNQATILSELGPVYEKSGASEKPDIWVLSGIMNIIAKILEMVESCRSEVMISIPEVRQDLVRQALPKLRALHDRGVQINILTSDRMDPEYLRSLSRVSTVKIKENLFGGGIISDRRYVMILLADISDTDASEMVAIWADHAGLAKFASEYFEYLLKDSRKP